MKKQAWVVGQQVKIGFLATLVVRQIFRASEGDKETLTILSDKDSGRLYIFRPYYGIEKTTVDEVKEIQEENTRYREAKAQARQGIESQKDAINALFK